MRPTDEVRDVCPVARVSQHSPPAYKTRKKTRFETETHFTHTLMLSVSRLYRKANMRYIIAHTCIDTLLDPPEGTTYQCSGCACGCSGGRCARCAAWSRNAAHTASLGVSGNLPSVWLPSNTQSPHTCSLSTCTLTGSPPACMGPLPHNMHSDTAPPPPITTPAFLLKLMSQFEMEAVALCPVCHSRHSSEWNSSNKGVYYGTHITLLVTHGPHVCSLRARERIEKLAFEHVSPTPPASLVYVPVFVHWGNSLRARTSEPPPPLFTQEGRNASRWCALL